MTNIFTKLNNLKDYPFLSKSYSVEGEDIILYKHMPDEKKGFYVDIGAHHPKQYSNTYLFYKKGWAGINIDAMPNSMNLFKKYRKRDINLELGVSLNEGELLFYTFDKPVYNTFSAEKKDEYLKNGIKLDSTVKVSTMPLSKILDQHLPQYQKINFFSIDVEGFDMDVINSNNWSKYRPDYIVVEDHHLVNKSLLDIQTSETNHLLMNLNYIPIAKAFYSVIYKNGQTM
jgi:FkbM family methyltransferase